MKITFLLVVVLFNTDICSTMTLTFSRLKTSPLKPDIKDFLPLFKSLQKPKAAEKNIKSLLSQLGSKYNPRFSSILTPESFKARDPSTFEIKDHNEVVVKSNPEMSQELKNMKFFGRKPSGKKKEYGKRLTYKFQQWLWNLSKCPVRYRWIDLGENIFPRFIKRGSCSRKKTCSFPAGMKCEKSKWKTVAVLIYTCLNDYNAVSSGCKWRSMDLDVLAECKCGCNK